MEKILFVIESILKEITKIGSLLLIVFIVLKCIEVIDWSWLLVLSPLWIGFGYGILFETIKIIFLKKHKS